MSLSHLLSCRLIALTLFLTCLGFQPQGSIPQDPPRSADEAELRFLAQEFYTAYVDGMIGRLNRVWSAKSPGLDARRQSVLQSYSTHEKIELKKLLLRRVLIANDTARLRLEVQLSAVESKTGKPEEILGQAKRAIHCVRENKVWKVWREIPAVEELVEALTAAQTDAARWALLQADQDFSAEEIVQELERQEDNLRSQGNQTEARARSRLAQSIAGRKK